MDLHGEASDRPSKREDSTRPRSELIEWKDLLPWQRDNSYVLTGYRHASHSYRVSLSSMFRWHNETINIWSHLLGALLFVGFLLHSYSQANTRYQSASSSDTFILAVFFAGVVMCFLLSTLFHVLLNHSEEAHSLGSQLDHLGIVIVIWASAVPTDYFGFYCDEHLRYLYWTVASATAISCAIFTLRPAFRAPSYRPMRSAMYACLGLSIFVPAAHGVVLNGWELQNQRMSLAYFIGLGVLNGTGTVIYTARVPERWYPKTFDLVGQSHQTMHVLVICGALSHTVGLARAFDYWHSTAGGIGHACSNR